MTKPAHHVVDSAGDRSFAQCWSVDQDDRQMQRARRIQFGAGAIAAGIFRNHMRDAVRGQQHQVGGHLEGTATNDDRRIRQRQRRFWPVDEAQQIKMLRRSGKGSDVAATDGEKNAGGRVWQRCGGGGDIRHGAPIVTGPRDPRRAFESDQCCSGLRTGGNRVAAHFSGKGMRGVDDVRDALGGEILDEAVDATKTAGAHGQRLRDRSGGSAGIGIDGIDVGRDERPGDLRRFGRAAEKENAHG